MASSPDPPALATTPPEAIDDDELGLRLRRARSDDLAFLVELVADPSVESFLAAVTPHTDVALRAEIRRGNDDPAHAGRLVAETGAGDARSRVGAIAYEVVNRRSRIAYISALALLPEHAGRGLGSAIGRLAIEYLVRVIGYHRVQCEIYAFNERALIVAERAGMTREGVRRRAYWRRDQWVDGVLFGVVADELAP